MALNVVYPAFVAIILLVQGALIGISVNNSHHISANSKQIEINTDIIARSQDNIMLNQKLLAQLLENEKEEIKYLRMITEKEGGFSFGDELPGK